MKIYDELHARLLKIIPPGDKQHSARTLDTKAIVDTIQRALASAGLDTQAGPMKGVNDTIQQALSAAGLHQLSSVSSNPGVTLDGVAREIDAAEPGNYVPLKPKAPIDEVRRGEFLSRSFTNKFGTREYKVYIPGSYSGEADEPAPLVVMLHGCTQSPDDFAAGTRMNELAEQHGFLVVYPAQAANANGSKCWNWFRAEDQGRDRGEPSIIAGITRQVASNYKIDKRRIFVAGLSAGAAMAVVLGATHPELYAAVGAHSGLAYGAAHDMPSAFSAMQGGGAPAGSPNPSTGPASRRQNTRPLVPTIVFHGDRDHTVNASNGAAIVHEATTARSDDTRLRASVHQGSASGGRTYTRTVYADAANQPVVEEWVLHGAGHAWSGGSSAGSFTEPAGPDASAEMIRFFYSQLRAGTA